MSRLSGTCSRNRSNVNPQDSLCNSPDEQTTHDGGDFGYILRMIEGSDFSGSNGAFNCQNASSQTAVRRSKRNQARSSPMWRRAWLVGLPCPDCLDMQERSTLRRLQLALPLSESTSRS